MHNTKNLRLSFAKHCFIVTNGPVIELLKQEYGRNNIALKIFDLEEIKEEKDWKTVKWGDDPAQGEPKCNTTIYEATQIQNICSWYGLAPRVYGLETVSISDKLVPAQVIEYTKGEHGSQEEADDIYDRVLKIGEKYGFGIEKRDVSDKDIIDGQLIDFQTFRFTTPYKETARKLYIAGKYGKVYYQDLPEFELKGGPRKSLQRLQELKLDQIDFKGKDVIDIGCAGGFFCRYAAKNGARRVVGVDIDEGEIEAARNIDNYLGYFNNDYVHGDFTKLNLNKTDIVFALSINYHFDALTKLKQLSPSVVIFEDNGKQSRHNTSPDKEWRVAFPNIQFIGRATDHGDKSIYHLRTL